MSKFREILKNRNFLFLWLGQIISQLGDRLDQMALIGLVYLRTQGGSGSTFEMAKILSFTILPVFLIGPVAGVYVDRWDRRRTMFICDFLRSILILSIPTLLFYSRSLIPIYVVIFIVFSIGRFFVPAKMAIIPDLVDEKDLLICNSLVNTTGMIAAILGFGLSGLIVEWLGAKSGFFLDSLSFFISGLLIFLIAIGQKKNVKFTDVGKEIVGVLRKSVLQEIKDGILYFIKSHQIRFTAGIIFILWSALGAVYVVLIVFVQSALGSVTKDLGLLAMCVGIGLFGGSLLYGRFGQRLPHFRTIFFSLVLAGFNLIAFALGLKYNPNFFLAALLSILLGIIVAPIMIAANTVVHRVSEDKMRGKIFSSLEVVMHLGFLLFMFMSSALAEWFSQEKILVAVGIFLIIIGVCSIFAQRKILWLE